MPSAINKEYTGHKTNRGKKTAPAILIKSKCDKRAMFLG